MCQNGNSSKTVDMKSVFRLQVHFHANQTHFHMKGFEQRFVLKPRHKVTRKWPIGPILVTPQRNVLWNSTLEPRSPTAKRKGELVIIFWRQTESGLGPRWVDQLNNSRLLVKHCIRYKSCLHILVASKHRTAHTFYSCTYKLRILFFVLLRKRFLKSRTLFHRV